MASKTIITPFILSNGSPALGLPSASVRIRDANSGELLVTDDSLVEVGDGFYKYVFTDYTSSMNYTIRLDGGDILGQQRYAFAANENYSFDHWEEPMNVHTSSVFISGSDTPISSSGQILNFLKNIEGGRWRIDTDTNQMIFYKDDNTTVVATYDLFDSDGTPSSINVFERRKT